MINYLCDILHTMSASGGELGQEMEKEIVKLKEQHAKQNPIIQVAAATSAPRLGSPLPTSAPRQPPSPPCLHLHRGWASPSHICIGTRLLHLLWPTLRMLIVNRPSALRPHETTTGWMFSGSS